MPSPKPKPNTRAALALQASRTKAGSQRKGMAANRAKNQTRRLVVSDMKGTTKPKTEEGATWQYAAARLLSSLGRARAASPRIVKFLDDAPKARARPSTSSSPKRISSAAKKQSAAAKTYSVKDPARISAGKKGAETRRNNMDAQLQAAKSRGRRQGATAVGVTGAAALGVNAAKGSERPKVKKK